MKKFDRAETDREKQKEQVNSRPVCACVCKTEREREIEGGRAQQVEHIKVLSKNQNKVEN